MSIPYKIISKKMVLPFPQEKHYAVAKYKGELDLNDMARKLSNGSTVRQSDVYAVLIGLIEQMKFDLADGYRIKLGELGSFSISLKSKGHLDSKKINARSIIGNKIQYRPTKQFKSCFRTLRYYKSKR